MAHEMEQAVGAYDGYESGERLDDLLEVLSIMEDAVTTLFRDVVECWDCSEPQVVRQLIERFSYLGQKVIKLCPQWHLLCDTTPVTCADEQIRIDQAREAIKIIEGELGWIYYIVYEHSPALLQ